MGLVFFFSTPLFLFFWACSPNLFKARIVFQSKSWVVRLCFFFISALNPDIANQNSYLAIRSSLSAVWYTPFFPFHKAHWSLIGHCVLYYYFSLFPLAAPLLLLLTRCSLHGFLAASSTQDLLTITKLLGTRSWLPSDCRIFLSNCFCSLRATI